MSHRPIRAWLGVSSLFLFLLGSTTPATAALVQIIHTNDLHSQLERSGDPTLGGYAAVKATIDALKMQSESRGIETLVLDAGDFTEGSEFFLADRGEPIWRIMNSMGYDAVTIGNHDWLSGTAELDRVLGLIRPSFAFLGANFHHGGNDHNLTRFLQPAAQFRKAGVRIAVLGLTTDDIFYNWLNDNGYVYPPVLEAFNRLKGLRQRNDAVIALTHLGVSADRALVRRTQGIDLVVGGHSHTRLFEPEYVQDRRGVQVPIVQAGEHGQYVGDLLVDITPGKPIAVVHYRLVPVLADGPRDEAIAREVSLARAGLEAKFGHEWLQEKVGRTEVELSANAAKPTVWTNLVAHAVRVTGKADVGLEVGEFTGVRQPPGDVTREQILKLYPRMFERNDSGWNVWVTKIPGFMMKILIKASVSNSRRLAIDGATYDLVNGKPANIKIGGRPVSLLKRYRLATAEGLTRGATEIFAALRLLIQSRENTRVPMWTSIENEIRRRGVIRAEE